MTFCPPVGRCTTELEEIRGSLRHVTGSNVTNSERSRDVWGWIQLRATLVWPGLARTWVDFDRDQICRQVDARILPFGHLMQVNASIDFYCCLRCWRCKCFQQENLLFSMNTSSICIFPYTRPPWDAFMTHPSILAIKQKCEDHFNFSFKPVQELYIKKILTGIKSYKATGPDCISHPAFWSSLNLLL